MEPLIDPRWTVKQFADWYLANDMPMRPPFENPIYFTEISAALVLFRHAPFQVELYLSRPNTVSPRHTHPGVESCFVYLAGNFTLSDDPNMLDKYQGAPGKGGHHQLFGMGVCIGGKEHGLVTKDTGGAFLSIEKWAEGLKVDSVTANWKGEPVGPVHEAHIR